MSEQKVVRTYPPGWTNRLSDLTKLLDKGYKVIQVTPIKDGIVEYIVEKQTENNDTCPLDINVCDLIKDIDELTKERNVYKKFYDDYRESQDRDEWGR